MVGTARRPSWGRGRDIALRCPRRRAQRQATETNRPKPARLLPRAFRPVGRGRRSAASLPASLPFQALRCPSWFVVGTSRCDVPVAERSVRRRKQTAQKPARCLPRAFRPVGRGRRSAASLPRSQGIPHLKKCCILASNPCFYQHFSISAFRFSFKNPCKTGLPGEFWTSDFGLWTALQKMFKKN
jgi:hypothetical protein